MFAATRMARDRESPGRRATLSSFGAREAFNGKPSRVRSDRKSTNHVPPNASGNGKTQRKVNEQPRSATGAASSKTLVSINARESDTPASAQRRRILRRSGNT
jgi:hypothetical protein